MPYFSASVDELLTEARLSATPCAVACNPTCSSLQAYVPEPASLRVGACSPMCESLQPACIQARRLKRLPRAARELDDGTAEAVRFAMLRDASDARALLVLPACARPAA